MKLLAEKPRDVACNVATNHFGAQAKLHLIGKGAASLVYLAEKGTKRYVIKIRPDHCKDYSKEAGVLKAIAKNDLGPNCVAIGSTKRYHYCIQGYIEGKRLPWKNATETDCIDAARFFKKLHSSTRCKSTTNHTQLRGIIVYAKETIHKAQGIITKQEAQRFHEAIQKLEKLSIPHFSCPVALRHGDPNPHNIIRTKRGIRGIDWEDAKDGPVITDLVDFIIKANLPQRKKELFLRTYGWKQPEAIYQWSLYRLLGVTTWHLEQCWLIKTGKHAHETYTSDKRRYWLFTRRLATLEKALHDNAQQ